MERMAWSDERLDCLSDRVDRGFDRVDRRFDETNRRIDELGSELRLEMEALRNTILRVGGGMMVGLVGVIAAVLARGV